MEQKIYKEKLGKDEKVKLIAKGETYALDNVLIGGIIGNKDKAHEQMGVYSGEVSCENIGLSMLHALRAAIRLLHDELGLPMDEIFKLIKFTVETALKMETTKSDVEAMLEKILADLTKRNG